MTRSISLVLVAALAVRAASSAAQENPGPPAFTNAAEAGPDLLMQGEYAGSIARLSESTQNMGLQIVALGDGKFEAVLYRGGLPGSGWDKGLKWRYAGTAARGKLNLTGPKDKFTVADGIAVMFTDAGKELGKLQKIERQSPTLGRAPPTGAVVLFDGGNTDQLQGAKVTPDGLLQAGVLTKSPVEAFQLHLEFRTPFMPTARGQARGNSGVYIQQRYELQILDSFGLDGAENECGGMYRQIRPDLNMCLPPLVWQTYDVWFSPARFSADSKTKLTNARLTVLHNGVPIHWHREVAAKTGNGKPEGPEPLPINLQDHKNPVVYRNVWIVPGYGDHRDGQSVASRREPASDTGSGWPATTWSGTSWPAEAWPAACCCQ